MVIYWQRVLQVFLQPLTKWSYPFKVCLFVMFLAHILPNQLSMQIKKLASQTLAQLQQAQEFSPAMWTSSTWVKNLSSTRLTEAQEHLLANRPNFAIVTTCPLNEDYIVAVEHAYSKLNQWEADELRVEVKNMLKRVQLPRFPGFKTHLITSDFSADNSVYLGSWYGSWTSLCFFVTASLATLLFLLLPTYSKWYALQLPAQFFP